MALGRHACLAERPGRAGRDGETLRRSTRRLRPVGASQDDFFRHVNGGWIGRTEIPADRALYGSFVQLLEKSEANLRAIIEDAAKADAPGRAPRPARSATSSPASWTRPAPNASASSRSRPTSRRSTRSRQGRARPHSWRRFSATESAASSGPMVTTDDKQSDRYIVYLNQGGIGLPDESYYRDAKFKPIREKYVAHVEKIFELAGLAGPEGRRRAGHGRRDRAGQAPLGPRQEPRPHADLQQEGPQGTRGADARLRLGGLARGLSAARDGVDEVIVRQPDYFTAMAGMLDAGRRSTTGRLWLKWHVLARCRTLS